MPFWANNLCAIQPKHRLKQSICAAAELVFFVFVTAFKPFVHTTSTDKTAYSIKAAARAPIPPTNAPMPAVAIAPEPSAAVVAAAAADSLGVADADSE